LGLQPPMLEEFEDTKR